MKAQLQFLAGLMILSLASLPGLARADDAPTGPVNNGSSSSTPAAVYPQLNNHGSGFNAAVAQASGTTTPTIPDVPRTADGTPLSGVVAPNSPAAASSGAPYTPPSGNYPGTGSSPQRGVVPAPYVPSPPTPATASAGAPSTPVSGNYPGSGSSPQRGVMPAPIAPSPSTPAGDSAGAMSTPVTGNYPGSGSSPPPVKATQAPPARNLPDPTAPTPANP